MLDFDNMNGKNFGIRKDVTIDRIPHLDIIRFTDKKEYRKQAIIIWLLKRKKFKIFRTVKFYKKSIVANNRKRNSKGEFI